MTQTTTKTKGEAYGEVFVGALLAFALLLAPILLIIHEVFVK